MMIRNITKNTCPAQNPRKAVTFRDRLCGMIGRRFDGFDALVFDRCSMIHTFFMSQKIDVLFLSPENKVLRVVHSLPPYVAACGCRHAVMVIELPEGAAKSSLTELGDHLDIDAQPIGELDKKKSTADISGKAAAVLYDGDTKI